MKNNKLNGHEIGIIISTIVGGLASIAGLILGVKNPRK